LNFVFLGEVTEFTEKILNGVPRCARCARWFREPGL